MSTERSSSAVRNLRSLFESKDTETLTAERRTTSQEGAREGTRPISRVRSSFVVVEEAPKMSNTAEAIDDMAELSRVSSASLRRQSFSENGDEQLLALKKIVSQESERRERDSSVQEAIPEAAIEATPISTPALEVKEEQLFKATKPTPSKLASSTTANPDKPVTAVDEEEVGPLKPANLTDAGTVSAGAALGPGAEDTLTKDDQTTTKKPQPLNSVPPTKALVSASRSPLATKPASKASVKELSRKVSRSSLTAPTAASNARAAEKRESMASNASTSTRPRARESTKPLNVSSHLLAPTAASRARHEQDTAKSFEARASTNGGRASTKPSALRPTPRSAAAPGARPVPGASQNTVRKAAPSDGGFLDRMTRPTAASQNRAHDKYEAKAPAKKPLPLHKKAVPAKTNGTKPADNGPEILTPPADTTIMEDESSILDLSDSTPLQASERAHDVDAAAPVPDAVTT